MRFSESRVQTLDSSLNAVYRNKKKTILKLIDNKYYLLDDHYNDIPYENLTEFNHDNYQNQQLTITDYQNGEKIRIDEDWFPDGNFVENEGTYLDNFEINYNDAANQTKVNLITRSSNHNESLILDGKFFLTSATNNNGEVDVVAGVEYVDFNGDLIALNVSVGRAKFANDGSLSQIDVFVFDFLDDL